MMVIMMMKLLSIDIVKNRYIRLLINNEHSFYAMSNGSSKRRFNSEDSKWIFIQQLGIITIILPLLIRSDIQSDS